MKEAVKHSKITFENMLKQWHNLTDKQRKEIQSNIDYLNEQLTISATMHWVTCSEKKPNKGEKVLLVYKGRDVIQSVWLEGDEEIYTHWMPLPEPPCV